MEIVLAVLLFVGGYIVGSDSTEETTLIVQAEASPTDRDPAAEIVQIVSGIPPRYVTECTMRSVVYRDLTVPARGEVDSLDSCDDRCIAGCLHD